MPPFLHEFAFSFLYIERKGSHLVRVSLNSARQTTSENQARLTMKKENNREIPDPSDQSERDLINPEETAGLPEPAEDSCGLKDQNVPIYNFEILADGQLMVMIRLGSEVYMLRRTRGGKLLLNK